MTVFGYGFCIYAEENAVKMITIMYWLWYLLIGLAAGWIANLIVKGSGSGFVINLIVGLIGGVLGGWLVGMMGWVAIGTWATFLSSIIGAVVLLLVVSLFTRRRVEQN